ncbi:MAG: DNA repair protein RecN, partial [Candidatus Heimdallarchaeota archaeon]|nr:DNA repair protein RecN [Candidatus Heimdallarchaeota archaeon]
EKLAELTSTIYHLSYESENSVSSQLSAIKRDIEELNDIDDSFKEKVEEIKSASALVEDVSEFVRSYKEKIELEGGKLEELRDRLGALSLLKKRYGGSIESVIEHRASLSKELEEANNFTSKINDLEKQLQQERSSAGVLAKKLSSIRKNAARRIENEVVRELRDLGIEDAEFDIRLRSSEANEGAANYIIVDEKNYKFNSRGIDEVDFQISLNIGEDLKPLSKVASGGEISRIMLALKTILAKNDKLPLLIFDEIDSGISGRIASIVGESMKNLSEYHQIIAITHLPQIASNADLHFMVEKLAKDDRVATSIKKLDKNERILEVAKLLSGDKITEASMISAREMIGIINTG